MVDANLLGAISKPNNILADTGWVLSGPCYPSDEEVGPVAVLRTTLRRVIKKFAVFGRDH